MGYDLTGAMRVLHLNSREAVAPRTYRSRHRYGPRRPGFQLATMSGAFAADFAASTWDRCRSTADRCGFAMSTPGGAGRAAEWRAARYPHRCAGTFGWAAGRVANCRYSVAIDSLGRVTTAGSGDADTGVVRPRSALVAARAAAGA